MSQHVSSTLATAPTSAKGAMLPAPVSGVFLVLSGLSAFGTGTRTHAFDGLAQLSSARCQTSGSNSAFTQCAPEQTRSAVSELRRLSGLTWEQLARVFVVSRRSLHLWASGRPIRPANEERLHRLLALLKQADRGNAPENRAMLLHDTDGVIPIDLLTEERYTEFIQLVGQGPGRRQLKLKPLSREAREARKPPPPERLVDALQDRVHVEPGQGRAARTARIKRRGRDG